MILTLLFGISQTRNIFHDNELDPELDNMIGNPTISALIPHDSIEIHGDAELDAFCAGNGTDGLTWSTAHRIENYSISMGLVQTGYGLSSSQG